MRPIRALAPEPQARDVAPKTLSADRLLELVRELVRSGAGVWIQVTGISMNPVLRDGDSVLLAGLTRVPRAGDVVFLDVAGAPLLHRVVRSDGRTLVTRGDAACVDDAPVPLSACVAHALAARRGSVLIALAPTLQFGLKPLLWFGAWRARLRLSSRMLRRFRPLSRALVRALS